MNKEVSKVIIAYPDRLTRFGFKTLEESSYVTLSYKIKHDCDVGNYSVALIISGKS